MNRYALLAALPYRNDPLWHYLTPEEQRRLDTARDPLFAPMLTDDQYGMLEHAARRLGLRIGAE